MVNYGDNSQLVALIPSNTITATATGSAVDLIQYTNEVAVILNCSAGGAGATCNVKLTHSDTSGGAYTDVSGATFTEVGNAASVQKLSVNKNEIKRFVKAVCTVAGTASYKIGVELIGEYQYVS
jgi:hypothetical protein